MKIPEHLANASEEVTKDALMKLEGLVEQYEWYQEQIDVLEAQLKEKKQFFNKVQQEEIPNLLNQHGLSEIKLKSGKKVIVKEEASVTVPRKKEDEFYKFLESREEDDIVKLHFAFNRMEHEKVKELFTYLGERDFDYTAERKVHPQTLKKYFKELLGIGLDKEERALGIKLGTYLRKQDVQDIANVFTYFKTTIK